MRKHITTITFIGCDTCDETFEWEGNPAIADDMAAQAGWVELDEDGIDWLCPTCHRRRKLDYALQADQDIV